jgi:alpha-tubulin suppressor-like RCC1 family protein
LVFLLQKKNEQQQPKVPKKLLKKGSQKVVAVAKGYDFAAFLLRNRTVA